MAESVVAAVVESEAIGRDVEDCVVVVEVEVVKSSAVV